MSIYIITILVKAGIHLVGQTKGMVIMSKDGLDAASLDPVLQRDDNIRRTG